MSTIQDQRNDYEKNPYFTGHIYANFSPFYVTIAICSVIFISIVLLNVVLACCSKHRKYWQDRHTGNRWLVSIWSATPHLQPPLDLTELKDVSYYKNLHSSSQSHQQVLSEDIEDIEAQASIHQPQHQRPPRPQSRALHHQRQREEYTELHKRESEI